MSVYVTLRVDTDPAVFEKQAAESADAIRRIGEIAKTKGLIAHRWCTGDGFVMVVDEWPDAQSFQTFFAAAESEIGPLMASAGVTSAPVVTVYERLDIGDDFGWGA
jgi:hypothetical protein